MNARLTRPYAFLVATLCLASAALAASGAVDTVSPGGSNRLTLVRGTSPTFSWGTEPDAQSYELMVYELSESGRESEQPSLSVTLPGSASSWTPDALHGLEAGKRYVWFVRTVTKGNATDWSRGRMFAIASAPSLEEVEAVMDVLRRYAAVDESDAGSPLGGLKREPGEGLAHEAPTPAVGEATAGVGLASNSLAIDADGPIRWDCPNDMDRVGTWCIDKVANAADAAGPSITMCHNLGKSLCPLQAIMTCDQLNIRNFNAGSCGDRTDFTGGPIRTFGMDTDPTEGNTAFDQFVDYNRIGNALEAEVASTSREYFCCRPVSP